MTENHAAGLSPALVETIAGLTAGSVATLSVHPLDIVKTRMQIHRSSSTGSSRANLTTVSVLRTLLQTPHPVGALYRGLTPNLLGSASSWASFFFFKDRVERAILHLRSSGGGGGSTQPSSSGDGGNAKAALAPLDSFVASALGGMCTQMLTNPIWVMKTRMVSSDRGAAGAYPSLWRGAMRLYRDEGWKGFYCGLGISLFGVTHGAVQFAVYDPLKNLYFKRLEGQQSAKVAATAAIGTEMQSSGGTRSQQQQPTPTMQKRQRMSTEATLVLSSFSKLVAGAVTYPYQVIRSRLQNYDAEERFGRGIRGVARRVWQEEGWRGFYRGVIPGVVRVLPATWVTFLVYENVRYQLQ